MGRRRDRSRSRSRSRSRDKRRRDRSRSRDRRRRDRSRSRSRSPEKQQKKSVDDPKKADRAAKLAAWKAQMAASQSAPAEPTPTEAPASTPDIPATGMATQSVIAAANPAALPDGPSQPASVAYENANLSDAQQTQIEIDRALRMVEADKAKAKSLGIEGYYEEVDPLDAFMSGDIKAAAAKEAEETRKKQEEDDRMIAEGKIDELTGGDGEQYGDGPKAFDPELHCYVCKKRGHTKKDCPDRKWDLTKVSERQARDLGLERACKHCGEIGHMVKECPAYKVDEKKKKRVQQYAVKALKRAEERKALKMQGEMKKAAADAFQAEVCQMQHKQPEDGLSAGERAVANDAANEAKKKSRWAGMSEAEREAELDRPVGDLTLS